MEECIPRAELPDRRNPPWLTKEIVRTIKKRNYYYKLARKHGRPVDYDNYKRLRNEVVNALRTNKAKFFSNLNPKSGKKFWSALRHLKGVESTIPTLVSNNLKFETGEEKAQILNKFFSKNFSNSLPPLNPACYQTSESSTCPDDLLCTEEEVYGLIAGIDTANSNGPDGISGKMLKATAMSITPAITRLFNISIKTGQLPQNWKLARVNPIPKSSDKSNPANYWPISLLSVFSKLMEKHIHSKLLQHLNEHSVLSTQQWGFSKGKATTGALLTTVQNWHQILEKGDDVCAIFFDLKKAFGSVPHSALMNKLSDLNLQPHLLQWIANYLSNRRQYVEVNGQTSATSPVISGVPQGSVLGPLLFLIYINDIANVELSDSSLLLYADDVLLYRPICCPGDYTYLQQDINTLHTWSEANLLQFNPSKCRYMVVSRKVTPVLPDSDLSIDGSSLHKVDHYKYLGVWLSHNLSWTKHIEETCKSATKQIGVMYRKFYRHSSQDTLKQLYLSLVRSKLEYAAPVWDPQKTTLCQKLEKVQKFALKVCSKNWSSDYEHLLNITNLPALSIRREYLKLTYLYQILNGSFIFPNAPLERRNIPVNLRNSNTIQFVRPICHTNAYMNSFFPHTISVWNRLPYEIQSSTSIASFKHNVMSYFCLHV